MECSVSNDKNDIFVDCNKTENHPCNSFKSYCYGKINDTNQFDKQKVKQFYCYAIIDNKRK